MGGGSGISVNSKTDFNYQIDNGKITSYILNGYDSFNMLGYEDGMDNIKGDLLKPIITINIENIIKILNNANINTENIYIEGDLLLDEMIFGGWNRSNINTIHNFNTLIENFTVYIGNDRLTDFENGEKLELAIEKECEANTIKTNNEIFDNMYNSIFNFNVNDEDIEFYNQFRIDNELPLLSKDETIQQVYNNHFEDVMSNYGTNS